MLTPRLPPPKVLGHAAPGTEKAARRGREGDDAQQPGPPGGAGCDWGALQRFSAESQRYRQVHIVIGRFTALSAALSTESQSPPLEKVFNFQSVQELILLTKTWLAYAGAYYGLESQSRFGAFSFLSFGFVLGVPVVALGSSAGILAPQFRFCALLLSEVGFEGNTCGALHRLQSPAPPR